MVTVVICALFSWVLVPAAAEEVWHPEYGWGVNLVETWTLLSTDEKLNNLNFTDSRNHAVLQIFTVAGSATAYGETLMAKMAAEPGEAGSSDFRFDGMTARLADYRWKAGPIPVRGYLLAVEGKDRGYLAVCYSWEEEWPTYHDFLLSSLDSFFIGEENKYLPGPLSQLVAGDGWHGGPIKDRTLAVDAAQNVADREARVLAAFVKAGADVQKKAWRRFYQMIYRDNFHRLDLEADRFIAMFQKNGLARDKIPVELLKWIQSFKFEEYKTLADLRVPVDAVDKKAGDCDGRGLIYMILLDRLGIDSILLVSSEYHHAMVGVDLAGPGYYFPQDGKNWMFAETTAAVPMGQIRSDMMDPKKWFGFDLHFTP